MNEMVISTFNIWLILLAGCFYLSFPQRGEESVRDVGLKNIFSASLGIIISWMLAQKGISGQIIESHEFSSVILMPFEHYLFYIISGMMLVIAAFDVYYYFMQRVIE